MQLRKHTSHRQTERVIGRRSTLERHSRLLLYNVKDVAPKGWFKSYRFLATDTER